MLKFHEYNIKGWKDENGWQASTGKVRQDLQETSADDWSNWTRQPTAFLWKTIVICRTILITGYRLHGVCKRKTKFSTPECTKMHYFNIKKLKIFRGEGDRKDR